MRLATVALASLLGVPALAEEASEAPAPTYQEGRHYAVFRDEPAAPAPEGKTEVLEFFWYNCPHCNELEPMLSAWFEERADTVQPRLVPAVFNARWAIGARVYYTLEEMGHADLHATVFKLVHEQGRPLKTGESIGRMLEPFGMDPAAFAETFRSQAVSDHLEATRHLPDLYEITGVPALVVDGRYRIGSNNAASYQEMLDIADYLVRTDPTPATVTEVTVTPLAE